MPQKTCTWHGYRLIRWVEPGRRHVWWRVLEKPEGSRRFEETEIIPGRLPFVKRLLTRRLENEAYELESRAYLMRLRIKAMQGDLQSPSAHSTFA